jgi:two-component system chemotaxis response regulator CheB
MATGFTAGMASWLDQQVPLPVALAEHEMPLRRGIWFAPDDIHLRLAPSMRTLLDAVTDVGVHRPAADVLLCSAAEATGAGAVGVVLTGMGRDGAEGIAAIRAAGGLTIAQDEESSIVWGMPRAAIERGAELVLAPAGIGGVLTGLAQRRT